MFLVDGERLESNAAALRKEHLELFRRARSKKQIVPGPQKILLDFDGAPAHAHAACAWTFPPLPGEPSARTADLFAALRRPALIFRQLHLLPRRSGGVAEERLPGLHLRRLRRAGGPAAPHPQGSARHDPPAEHLGGLRAARGQDLVIQEAEIFGRKRHIPRSVGAAKSAAIESFVELTPGDFVVHVNYGIGVFLGIERIAARESGGTRRERAGLHHPGILRRREALHPHRAGQPHPALHRPGGQEAQARQPGREGLAKRKEKAKKAVEELAQGLLELYSRRKAEPGFAFTPDTDWQSEFEAAFPYQETEDQLSCIEEVKSDMESPIPMDRLVCGDVGYGKTEIALRAAFKAVMSGKQVGVSVFDLAIALRVSQLFVAVVGDPVEFQYPIFKTLGMAICPDRNSIRGWVPGQDGLGGDPPAEIPPRAGCPPVPCYHLCHRNVLLIPCADS